MNRFLKMIALALLTLIALSPLVLAGPRPGHRPTTSFRSGSGSSFGTTSGFHSGSVSTFKSTSTTFSTGKPIHHGIGGTSFGSTGHHFNTGGKPFKHVTTGKPSGSTGHHLGTGGKPFVTTGKPFVTGGKTATGGGFKTASFTGYAAKNGVKFSKGIYYKGFNHRHWAKRHWSPRWGTWCWFCPSAKSWFYYNSVQAVYYPVSYITVAPPVVVAGPAQLPPGGEDVPTAPPGEEPEVPTQE